MLRPMLLCTASLLFTACGVAGTDGDEVDDGDAEPCPAAGPCDGNDIPQDEGFCYVPRRGVSLNPRPPYGWSPCEDIAAIDRFGELTCSFNNDTLYGGAVPCASCASEWAAVWGLPLECPATLPGDQDSYPGELPEE